MGNIILKIVEIIVVLLVIVGLTLFVKPIIGIGAFVFCVIVVIFMILKK